MTEQDKEHCTICGRKLDHTPKLGELIMHTRCKSEVMVRVAEAENRGFRRGKAARGR